MNNQTSHEDILSFKKQVIYINSSLIAILGLGVIAVNGILLWALNVNPQRNLNRPKITLDIWHLLNAWLMGFVLAPMMIADEIINETTLTIKNETLRTFNIILTQFFLANGTLINTFAIIEGTSGLTYPHWNRKFFTRRNIKTFLVVVFTVDLIFSSLYALNIYPQLHLIIFAHIFIVLPILINFIIFQTAYKKILQPANKNSVHEVTSTFTKEKVEMARRKTQKIAGKFIKTVIAFFAPFVITSTAYYIYAILNFFYSNEDEEQTRWRVVVDMLVLTLLFIFPAFFPLVLITRIPEYKNATKYVLGKARRKR